MGANTRDLKRRIRSVSNTSQLTRAMKMVSAAKLRRAQDAMTRARPYAHALRRILGDVGRRVSAEAHPLLARREVRAVDIVVITADKGLCGAFNASIVRAAEGMIRGRQRDGQRVELILLGRKGVESFRRRSDVEIAHERQEFYRGLDYAFAREISEIVAGRFVEGRADATFLVFNNFKSTISQQVVVHQLLPVQGIAGDEAERGDDEESDYIYEPNAAELMNRLLPRYLGFQIYHALLESVASEHAARMTAMDNATRNAQEMIEKLTLQMNRARQAAITTEIIEVVSGAAAL